MRRAPDYKAKRPVFEEIVSLLVANQMEVHDFIAYADAAEILALFMKQEAFKKDRRGQDETMKNLFKAQCERLEGQAVACARSRIMNMAVALDSLTK